MTDEERYSGARMTANDERFNEAEKQRNLRQVLRKVIDCCPLIPGEKLHDAITEAEAELTD